MTQQKDSSPCSIDCGNSCMNCPIRELSLLQGLSFDELALLNENRSRLHFKAGEYVYRENEQTKGLLALHNGKLKIVKSGLFDNNAIVSLKKPGDIFGLESLVLEKQYTTCAIALEPTSVCVIDRDKFLKVIKGNVELSLRVMRLLAKVSEDANDRMLVLTQKHMRGRLADSLLWLNRIYGTESDHKTLNVELKRADLAAMANMTQANAIRVLSSFSKEKLITVNKRQIKIVSFELLESVSGMG